MNTQVSWLCLFFQTSFFEYRDRMGSRTRAKHLARGSVELMALPPRAWWLRCLRNHSSLIVNLRTSFLKRHTVAHSRHSCSLLLLMFSIGSGSHSGKHSESESTDVSKHSTVLSGYGHNIEELHRNAGWTSGFFLSIPVSLSRSLSPALCKQYLKKSKSFLRHHLGQVSDQQW